ncbi:MAG: hypothetical protein LBS03_01035 [Bacteroidales bacterium]|nr:hypothetical protein [Bacteroidales bacterium]
MEAGNVLMHFSSPEKLKIYSDYLASIDVPYYAAINKSKGLEKVIILPVVDMCVYATFTVQEFETLKELIRDYLANRTKKTFIRCSELQPLNPN